MKPVGIFTIDFEVEENELEPEVDLEERLLLIFIFLNFNQFRFIGTFSSSNSINTQKMKRQIKAKVKNFRILRASIGDDVDEVCFEEDFSEKPTLSEVDDVLSLLGLSEARTFSLNDGLCAADRFSLDKRSIFANDKPVQRPVKVPFHNFKVK